MIYIIIETIKVSIGLYDLLLSSHNLPCCMTTTGCPGGDDHRSVVGGLSMTHRTIGGVICILIETIKMSFGLYGLLLSSHNLPGCITTMGCPGGSAHHSVIGGLSVAH